VLATVYVTCVAWLATAARTDVAVLLGRVAAHELGHLVIRTSAHARRGLMRPHWTPDEVGEIARQTGRSPQRMSRRCASRGPWI
jgi:hypothetical protein